MRAEAAKYNVALKFDPPGPMTPLIHVIDDDPGFRDSLRSLLESDKLAVATYADAADFLERYLPEQPGCLLLDVRLPGTSGLPLQDELLKRDIRIPTVFITADDEALIRRVRGALISDALARDASRRLALLSAREIEVLERVVQGKPKKVIAEELGLAVKIIEFHRKRIMHKLRVKTVADLIHFIAQRRLPERRATTSSRSGPC
jgi:FixJ family two-component response regulator